MKYIRFFNKFDVAKNTEILGPNLTLIKENNVKKLLKMKTQVPDTKCKIIGDNINDAQIIVDDVKAKYLTIESIADGTTFFVAQQKNPTTSHAVELQYSLDDGATWQQYALPAANESGSSIELQNGQKLLLKGNNPLGFNEAYIIDYTTGPAANFAYKLQGSGSYKIYGNALSLIYGDRFQYYKTLPNHGSFGRLFQQNTALTAADIYIGEDTEHYAGFQIFTLNSQLTTIKLHGIATGDAFVSAFYGCTSLETVDLTYISGNCSFYQAFTASNVKNVLFGDKLSITTLQKAFLEAQNIESIDLPKLDLSNCTLLTAAFKKSGIKSVDFSNCNMKNVEDMQQAFLECANLKTVDFSNCDFCNLNDMSYAFCGTTSLEEISMSSSEYHDCICAYGFLGSSCKKIDFSQFKIHATEISWLFGKLSGGGCIVPYLQYLDLSGVDSSKTDGTLWSGQQYNHSDIIESFDDRYTFSSLKYARPGFGADNSRINVTGKTYSDYFPAITDKHDFALALINGLQSIETERTLYLGQTYLDVLSEEEKAIAENKGWTLA